jgi:hypothetical protein
MVNVLIENVKNINSEIIDEEFHPTIEGDRKLQEAAVELGFISEADATLLNERNIIKMDKHAKKNRLITKSVMVIAREKNDPDYKKLEFYNAKRMFFKRKLIKKYKAPAKARAAQILRGGGATKIAKEIEDDKSK